MSSRVGYIFDYYPVFYQLVTIKFHTAEMQHICGGKYKIWGSSRVIFTGQFRKIVNLKVKISKSSNLSV